MSKRPYLLGTMQGRLLPKYQGRYQAHPVGYWDEEFFIAADLGLDLIEFILDYEDVDQNPLSHSAGINKISRVVAKTGVRVKSICADYFMIAPLHAEDTAVRDRSFRVLQHLIQAGNDLGVTDIVIPCVDQSSLRTLEQKERLISVIKQLESDAERAGIHLALEADLPPLEFKSLLDSANCPSLTVNYDTGNSASLGFDPSEEFLSYGKSVTDIHIKDRRHAGGPVPLGEGDTRFDLFFAALDPREFKGHFIMQAYRDDAGLEIFKRQLEWIRPKLDKWAGQT
jgi:hexulose-6-phosphate isomerase